MAKKRGADYVFCGHTHKAMRKRKGDIVYYNSGCWTDSPCTYITIDEKYIDIHYYKKPNYEKIYIDQMLAAGTIPVATWGKCMLPPVLQLTFFLGGAFGGFFLGIHWWNVVYVEKRHWRSIFSRI